MAYYQMNRGCSSRFGSEAVDPQPKLSGRQPARTFTAPSSTIPSTSTSKIAKRNPLLIKSNNAQLQPVTRLPCATRVAQVSCNEMRCESLPSRTLPISVHTSAKSQTTGLRKSRLLARPQIVPSGTTLTSSLASGLSASRIGSARPKVVRRKTSIIGTQNARNSPGPAQLAEATPLDCISRYRDPYPNAVLGINMPTSSPNYRSRGLEEVINLDQYVDAVAMLSPTELPLSKQFIASSSTPSTVHSPGPFSVSSTPTSMSSVSPEILISSNFKHGPINSEVSPASDRTPVVQKVTDKADVAKISLNGQGLAPVRELCSSSAATIKGSSSGRGEGRPNFPHQHISKENTSARVPNKLHARRKSSPTYFAKSQLDASSSVQSPPELAHLKDNPLRRTSLSSKPMRPSRDGTPEISLSEHSPVIQSNLSSLPSTLHSRQSSSGSKEIRSPQLRIETKYRFGLSRPHNAPPSPSQSSVSPLLPLQVATITPSPNICSDGEKSTSNKTALPGKQSSRFGFFTRRIKNETTTRAAPERERKLRKGPTAGTGHEGYGRFAKRGRSGSTTSGSGSTNGPRSPSTDSAIGTKQSSSRKSSTGSKTDSDVDDWLVKRWSPITLRGTGLSQHALEKKDGEEKRSEHATVQGSDLINSSSGFAMSAPTLMRPVLLPSLMPEPKSSGSSDQCSNINETKEYQPGKRSNILGSSILSTRRVSRTTFLSGKIDTNTSSAPSLAMGSSISDQPTAPIPTNFSILMEGASEGKVEDSSQSTGAESSSQVHLKPPRKWGFFQRAKSPARKAPPAHENTTVVFTRQVAPRSIAHYVMTEVPPPLDGDELEKIMQEAEATPESWARDDNVMLRSKSIRHENSMLPSQPSNPLFESDGPARPASAKAALSPRIQTPERLSILQSPPQLATESLDPQVALPKLPRPSRLAQVGRIPRVISKRDRERKLSDASFSRPFVPTQPSPALRNGASPYDQATSSPEFVEVRGARKVPVPPRLILYGDDLDPTLTSGSKPQSTYIGSGEIFTFPPCEISELSTTWSDTDQISMTATSAANLFPRAPPMEDDVWNEYDDLLDLLSPQTPKTPKTPLTGSSLGSPFQYSNFNYEPTAQPADFPSQSYMRPPPLSNLQDPSVASFAQRMRQPSLPDSRLLPSQPSGKSTSDFRMTECLTEFGEGNLSPVDLVSGGRGLPPNGRLSSSTSRADLSLSVKPPSSDSRPPVSSFKEPSLTRVASNHRDTHHVERAKKDHLGLETMANLRFSALMTSKWLSFGRVLFSPIHFELERPAKDRVLILDGLGRDWSYYVALTYPTATIYNLGTYPADTSSSRPAAGSAFQSLPNHRHVHHPSLFSPFPFPKGFFAAVVFRFPNATSEISYRSAFSECKRVLRPGGYLEVSVLDIDMLNMGTRARSALRGLKMRMQVDTPDISLKPISDTIQRLLGRRGFENLKCCMVGVPAAGQNPGPDGGMFGSKSKSSSMDSDISSGDRPYDSRLPPFRDVLRERTVDVDEGTSQMVARVGRWWHSHCYENVNAAGGKSIWADEALLHECRRLGTSFRLMVCYAQKPDRPVRRTISV